MSKSTRMGCCSSCGKQLEYSTTPLILSLYLTSFCGNDKCIVHGHIQENYTIPYSDFEDYEPRNKL